MSLANYFGFAMSLVYLAAGVFIFLSDNIFNLSDLQQVGLGGLLTVYGFFRFYRTLKDKKETEQEEDD